MDEFQVFAEWKIRRLPEPPEEPKDTYRQRVRAWALSSIGVDGLAQETFLFLEKVKMATLEDFQRQTGKTAEEVQDALDQLYTAGLIDRIGKAYILRDDLSASIVHKLIPRVTEALRSVAKTESGTRAFSDQYRSLEGKAYSDIREAVSACRDIFRRRGTPLVKVIGVQAYGDESVELEGPVADCSFEPPWLILLAETGDKIVIGRRGTKGVDVHAHTVIIKGERSE